MKKLCCALLLCLPVTVMAYPFELEKQLNGAEVTVFTQEIDQNIAGVQLYNHGQRAAKCSAVFRNGPEAPRTRQVTLDAGQIKTLTFKAARSIIKLRIDLTCNPI